MRKAFQNGVGIRRALVVAGALSMTLVSGCAGTGGPKLYDGTNAAVAAQARETFEKVEITAVVDQSLANLEAMLQRELAVVDEDFKLQRDRALLAMAESGEPISAWLGLRLDALKSIGFQDTAALRTYEVQLETFETELGKVEKNARFIRSLGVEPPKCEADTRLPAQWTPPRPPTTPNRLSILYDRYKASCDAALTKAPPALSSGSLGRAQHELEDERTRMAATQNEAAASQKSVAIAAQAYAEALEAATAEPSRKNVAALQDKAKELKEAIESASKAVAEVDTEQVTVTYIEQLRIILTAFATGEVEESDIEEQPELRAAATVVSALPSLAAEATALANAGDKPTVSNLLIELNHQRIVLEWAKEMQRLSERTITLRQEKIQALLSQASETRQIQLHLCALAVLAGGGDAPGAKCDQFTYTTSDSGLVCQLGDELIPSCILGKPWRLLLKDGNLQPRRKRELYAAVLAYGRAIQAQSQVTRSDFRIIDVAHRRTAVSNRAALLAWQNLVDVPTSQLAAYHASGITPDALARSIANLMGLTAIAVGAAQ